jgi:hypothetical protein
MSLLPDPKPTCAQAEELLMLRIYDELPLEDAEALDAHLATCENCRRELAALRALEETLALAPPPEPPAQLLAETRQRLAVSLDDEARRQWLPRLLSGSFQAFRTPLAAAAMLIAGVGFGGFGGYQLGVKAHPVPPPAQTALLVPEGNSPVASVSSVAPQPDGKGVVVGFNRLVPESTVGSTDDPAIRQLLAMGIQSPTGPDVQDNSVRMLADACSHGPQCDDGRVLSGLMTAARYDGDAILRGKALNDLEPYISQDMRVRDVVLDSLMHDTSPEVRAQAINMLSPVESDSSVRQVLHNVSNSDQDPEIRSRSRTMSKDASDVGLQIQ